MSRQFRNALSIPLSVVLLAGCANEAAEPVSIGYGPNPTLPAPEDKLIPTVKVADAERWRDGEMPIAAPGLEVTNFADGLDHPRWLHVLPNGDVLVAESNAPPKPEDGGGIRGFFMNRAMSKAGAAVPSADRISILRDTDGDGRADIHQPFLTDLYSPFGMALVDNTLYVANTDAIVAFPYEDGALSISAEGQTVTDLPAGPINHHWTKNIIASRDGKSLYATVGSNSNVAENGMEAEEGRAAIWKVDLSIGDKTLFAQGLRNPNGLAFEPETGELWTAVNERDELGDNLVPDYVTSVSQGDFFGWPWYYYGDHVDSRVRATIPPELEARNKAPDYALGSHTASLGIAFAEGANLPSNISNGLFVAQHGSWNRNPRSGYKVIFVPFDNGQPSGSPIPILTGFLDGDEARGRPVDVAVAKDGALLITDDVGNTVWRVSKSDQYADSAQ